ncbi:Mitochondrial distribution and morphology protein 12 [Dimargaris verticillata]|uniref:Mitochondrial distribution and morphology protein 12 n=1 Tax=Dimargaris verticillata TaxID=2761393 RepID=A0A9W8B441_9FUNG|nr:Mitochondrial distribution and morphology protein 12 [Dimargaris verticillata]
MSFEIYWDKLDHTVAKTVRERLNTQFAAMDKPDIIGDLEIADLDFGSVPPTVEILDITDPFPEFYWPDADNGHDTNQAHPMSAKSTTKDLPNASANTSNDPSYFLAAGETSLAHEPTPAWPAPGSNKPSTTGSIRGTHHSLPHQTLPPRRGPKATPPPILPQEIPMPTPRAQDTQIHLALAYKGDMNVTIRTSLRLNYPSLAFVELPVVLRMTGFDFSGKQRQLIPLHSELTSRWQTIP